MRKETESLKRSVQELLERARSSIVSAGYSSSYTKRILDIWNRVEQEAIAKNYGEYSSEFGEKFLLGYHGLKPYEDLTRVQRETNRAIKMLNDVMALGYVFPLRIAKGYIFPKQFEDIFTKYFEHRNNTGRNPHEIRDSKLYLEGFGRFLDERGIINIADVDMYVIHDALNAMSKLSKSTVEKAMRTIRSFFQWAHDNKYVPHDLSTHIPKTVYFKHKKLPSVYSPEELKRLLACIDRGNAMGKRDYAMILLAVRTGLRSGDICNLEFKNILWESNRIELIQHKTGYPLSLPLSTEVGDAIIDYLKYGRPNHSKSANVFVKHVPNYDAFVTSQLYTHVRKYMHKAKIFMPKARKSGTHTLRHSLASLLLEKDVPLHIISGVLGHVDSDTTGEYLKIDVKKLRSCALDVPEHINSLGGLSDGK